jgi:hypothetical protein
VATPPSYRFLRTTHLWAEEKIYENDGNTNDDANESKNNPSRKNLEEDIASKVSVSRNRAISALSRPNSSNSSQSNEASQTEKSSPSKSRGRKRPGKLRKATPSRTSFDSKKFGGNGRRKRNEVQGPDSSKQDSSFSSLLPPPIKDQTYSKRDRDTDALSEGLSSWEDFLGGAPQQKSGFQKTSPLQRKGLNKNNLNNNLESDGKIGQQKPVEKRSVASSFNSAEKLPSIADLFPPDLSQVLRKDDTAKSTQSKAQRSSTVSPPPPSLDGVLPVSDLFYRSAQSMSDEDESLRDDEELPFSAEQSDRLTTEHNKIKIRRNQAKPTLPLAPPKAQKRNRKSLPPRKMVRRGMEMLVGGVPINADPPQRSAELYYQHEKSTNWNEVISLNSRDFGPMLHGPSVGSVSKIEQGLFCEHFTHAAIKWDVCAPDLKTIVKDYTSNLVESTKNTQSTEGSTTGGTLDKGGEENDVDVGDSDTNASSLDADAEREMHRNYVADLAAKHERGDDSNIITSELPGLGFGTLTSLKNSSGIGECNPDPKKYLGGELVFSIGVSKEELESADSPSKRPVLERVLARGIVAATGCNGFDVSFRKLILVDMDDGTTMVTGDFTLAVKDNEAMSADEIERKAQRINSSLAQAMDDGDMQLALAAAAKEESEWSQEVRDRVVEEFLFEDDDGDGPLDDDERNAENSLRSMSTEVDVSDGKVSETSGTDLQSLEDFRDEGEKHEPSLIIPGNGVLSTDEAFLGGGNDGVFWNYSEKNAKNSPYGGTLGLRLVDAVVQRAKERIPRVIAIGDVHGCIDELQDLLRECDYRPGDLVVFLGDLVSKGPDSTSVVQMAREIGAIGVRGNHDFEVIRWHQAIMSGVDPPVVGSEHFHIASCLSKADMKWMYSLPWYIASKELGALFVHAGFVSGIRLGKQNPRLMMNMRSILPDGTVTSKFFNNWPWARLWDGPQTVLFGHDADRGLQQYEHAIGLDTGCVYGGRLTACILPEKRLVSVSARREYFKYRRKHYD